MTDDGRPGESATAFRVNLYVGGERRSFPMFADAAYDNAKVAALSDDAPFSARIIDQLGDREVLMWSISRVLIHKAKKGTGTFYFTDDDGHDWGILAGAITAVEVEDPDAKDRKRRRTVGFNF